MNKIQSSVARVLTNRQSNQDSGHRGIQNPMKDMHFERGQPVLQFSMKIIKCVLSFVRLVMLSRRVLVSFPYFLKMFPGCHKSFVMLSDGSFNSLPKALPLWCRCGCEILPLQLLTNLNSLGKYCRGIEPKERRICGVLWRQTSETSLVCDVVWYGVAAKECKWFILQPMLLFPIQQSSIRIYLFCCALLQTDTQRIRFDSIGDYLDSVIGILSC